MANNSFGENYIFPNPYKYFGIDPSNSRDYGTIVEGEQGPNGEVLITKVHILKSPEELGEDHVHRYEIEFLGVEFCVECGDSRKRSEPET